ncbi:hypothetical protein PR048_022157 [Dryococelus australis]|uniref:Uncharacterized protein n=1 Tax=Dryococelus australis TaxID=614101 RepID=A0ABQ9H0D2_9NEOP|nr:hypothetical protein PR048_022157 [Dryococelus australis]
MRVTVTSDIKVKMVLTVVTVDDLFPGAWWSALTRPRHVKATCQPPGLPTIEWITSLGKPPPSPTSNLYLHLLYGLHLQEKPCGAEGDSRHSWEQEALSQGLGDSGCNTGWCTWMLSGCEMRCDTTVWLVPRNLCADSTRFSCRSVQYITSSNKLRVCKVHLLVGNVKGQAIGPVDLGANDGGAVSAIHANTFHTRVLPPVCPEQPPGTVIRMDRVGPWWLSGKTARLPPRLGGFNPQRVQLRVFACGNHVGRCHWLAGFLEDFQFPTLSFRRCFTLTSTTSIGSQDSAWLSCSLPTKANWVQSPAESPNFRMWELCRTMPSVGGFSRGSPVSPALPFRRHSTLTSITLIGSTDLAITLVSLLKSLSEKLGHAYRKCRCNVLGAGVQCHPTRLRDVLLQQHEAVGAVLCGHLYSVEPPRSSLEIFLSFMSDQKMVPVCMLDAVATTFSTVMGTLSRPCSFRSATRMECRFEITRYADEWSAHTVRHTNGLAGVVVNLKQVALHAVADKAALGVGTLLRTFPWRVALIQVHARLRVVAQYLALRTQAQHPLQHMHHRAPIGTEATLMLALIKVTANSFITAIGTVWLPVTHVRDVDTALRHIWALPLTRGTPVLIITITQVSKRTNCWIVIALPAVMGKGRYLTELQKRMIIGFQAKRNSILETAMLVNCSYASMVKVYREGTNCTIGNNRCGNGGAPRTIYVQGELDYVVREGQPTGYSGTAHHPNEPGGIQIRIYRNNSANPSANGAPEYPEVDCTHANTGASTKTTRICSTVW